MIQAGKELRVTVEPERIDDEGCRQIARRIRSRIENELTYTGVIEITVIREQRLMKPPSNKGEALLSVLFSVFLVRPYFKTVQLTLLSGKFSLVSSLA